MDAVPIRISIPIAIAMEKPKLIGKTSQKKSKPASGLVKEEIIRCVQNHHRSRVHSAK